MLAALGAFKKRTPVGYEVTYKTEGTSMPVFLTATNPNQVDNLTCIPYLDGAEWKRESVSAPQDKVSCAGIVP